jgi:hypothetical protein
MSTSYRIAGRGRKFTKLALIRLSIEKDWTWKDNKKAQTIVVKTHGGYVHLYKTGRTAYNAFERFGLNDPNEFMVGLVDCGYAIYSEHDVNFWRCR